ncbi:MAG: peptidase S8, partial [Coriobacteriia bacterium]|nr:peptidase S8 [Coriobacteriia bacterium]
MTTSLPAGGASAQAVETTARVIVGWDGAREEVLALRALGTRGLGLERRLFGGRAGTVRVPSGWEPEAFARLLETIPGVAYAEPDYPVRAVWTPDDPLFAVAPRDAYQWAPRRIQAEEAWDLARGAGVLVAVVDTGVDLDHPDLVDNIEAHLGWDFVNGDGDPSDDNGHGTHCAGTVAAVTDNATGIAGMAPEARILPVKVLDSGGGGSTSTLAEGIDYAVAQGADVISMSVGGATGSTTLRLAVSNAAAAGAVLVAASGNEGAGTVLYPAAYAESLCIGATDAGDARTSYSNYGTALDLMAPGGTASQAIISTVRDGYGVKYGTSMATPHVAGLAALLIGERPHLSPGSVATLLSATAVDLGAPGWDIYTGSGLVQARAAVDHMLSDATPPTSVATTGVALPEGVAVTITADDIGLGVDRVEWVLGEGTSGRGAYVEITTPGWHTLQYAAVDIAGNREATRAVSFEVTDTLPPVTV